MVGLIGKKLGQTRVYDSNGVMVPVTVVLAGPNRVMQCKTTEKDGYEAVQLGFDEQRERRVNKPSLGHCRKHQGQPVRFIREFRDFSSEVKPGDTLDVNLFEEGDFIDVIAWTKGRGFQGVVKRYGFAGGPDSHGTKGWSRRTGALGQRLTPGHIVKGKKMPGHMGQRRQTIQNLQVIRRMDEDHVLLIKGALPGAKGDYVILRESKKRPKQQQAAA